MKPIRINRNRLGRMNDRELTDLWQQTGGHEYAFALLLNYLPFIYGVVSKYTHDASSARKTVSKFAAAFPEMADRFADTEPFNGTLYREVLRYIDQSEDETLNSQYEFISKLSSGEEDAVTVFTEGKQRLTKPQRECIELFLLRGKPFRYISENTGYLRQNIRSYIESGIAELNPAVVTEPVDMPLSELHTKFIYYIRGESSAAASYEVELHSMGNRFLADALEGYEVPGGHAKNLTELDREISVGEVPDVTTTAKKKNISQIAVTLVGTMILIVAGFLIFGDGLRSDKVSEPETPVEPTPIISADTVPCSEIIRGEGKAAIVRISERAEGPVGMYVSVPEIGINKYNEYLDKAVVKPADGGHGEVTLSFRVNKYGRPSRIRIVEFLSQDAHREAIRLIENGPEWTTSDEEVTIVLMFE